MRKFFLFLLICVFVFGADFNKEFAEFDKNYKSANYENKLKYHHSLKNIYIKTIINNDDTTKIKALQRLVLSAKNLGLDASLYNNELEVLYKKYPKLAPAKKKPAQKSTKITTQSTSKQQKIDKKTPPKQSKFLEQKPKLDDKKQTTQKKAEKNTPQSNQKPQAPIQAKQEEKQIPKQQQIYILKSAKNDNQIKLFFNQLPPQDPKHHTFTNNGFISYIYNFENVIADKPEQFEFNKELNASLVQFSPKDARLVIRSKNQTQINLLKENDVFVFNIGFEQKTQEATIKNDIKPNQDKPSQTKISQDKPKQEQKISQETAKQNQSKQIYILQSIQSNNQVKLHFNSSNIENPKQNIFKDNQTNHYIYLFENVIVDKPKQFKLNDINANLVQYDKKNARLVISSKQDLNINLDIKDTLMIFDISAKTSKQSKFFATNTNKESTKDTSKTPPKQTNTITVKKSNKPSKLITIDAGHGGKDGGANADGRIEKNITLQIALKLKKELDKRGYKVYLTRNKDTFISLRNRTKMANDKMSDLFISIHANSVQKSKKNNAYGIETYFLSPARSERSKNAAAMENKSDINEMDYFSKQTFLNFLNREKIISSNKLAIDIQSGMLTNLRKHYKKNIKDGGVREAPFWVLVGALMPAVLIEVGYITHPIEGKNIATSSYQDKLVVGIADGIDAYFAKNH